MQHTHRPLIWSLIALLLFTTAATLPRLNDALWSDEQRTLWYAGTPPTFGPTTLNESVQRIVENRWQAPAYYLIIRLWGQAFNWQPGIMRLLSLYSGLLTVAVVYQLGKRLFTPRAGLFAAFTLGVSAFYIHYLHDMRNYALLVLLTTLMLWGYWNLRDGRRLLPWLAVFVGSVALGLYTHYFTIIPIAALGLYHLFFAFQTPRYWLLIGGFTVGGVIFLPWAGMLLSGLETAANDGRSVRALTTAEIINGALNMFSNEARALLLLLILPTLHPAGRGERFAWFNLIAALTIALVINQFVPVIVELRYIIYVFPVLALLAGLGIHRASQSRVPTLAIIGVWGVFALWSLIVPSAQHRIHDSGWTLPYPQLRAALLPRTQPDDAVLYLADDGAEKTNNPDLLAYYLRGVDMLRGRLIPSNRATPDAYHDDLIRQGIDGASRVWLTYETDRRHWRVGPVTDTLMPAQGYAHCGNAPTADDVTLMLFTRPTDANAQRFGTDTDNQVTVYPFQPALLANNQLEITLGWDMNDAATPGLHSLNLTIEDSDGNPVTSGDYGMPTNQYACTLDTLSLAGQPPGTYTLRLSAYNWQTGEPLPGGRPSVATVTLD